MIFSEGPRFRSAFTLQIKANEGLATLAKVESVAPPIGDEYKNLSAVSNLKSEAKISPNNMNALFSVAIYGSWKQSM